ncbi:MAG: choice-of-anchor tandem repeat GloVer-containing protein [Bacteroidia bacterium]
MKKLFAFILILTFDLKAQDIECELWGLASIGCSYSHGSVFSYNLNSGALTKHAELDFHSSGSGPYGSLFQASNGNLFFTTWAGGNGVWSHGGTSCTGCGTLEEYDTTTNTVIKRYDFDYDSGPGGLPYGNLIQASDGYLYGMTSSSLIGSGGALFKYDIASAVLTDLKHFSAAFGYSPQGDLLQATDGKLYGMAMYGGLNNEGCLFYYDIVSDTLVKLLDFDFTLTGGKPNGSLIQASDGLLYGLMMEGGANNAGTLFSYDITTNTFSKKIDFNYPANGIGCMPMGSLMQADNGKLYGLTNKGGLHNFGTLFEYNITSNILTKKYDFNGINGKYSKGTLMQASNRKLYGQTQLGGSFSGGVLFEYDIDKDTLIKKADFVVTTGYKPAYLKLIEICKPAHWDPLSVTAPNIFSPNGDGINDNWTIILSHKEQVSDLSVFVYNRWGQEVFRSDDKNFSWNGHTTNGENCTDGTYYYTLKYSDQKKQQFSRRGFITLSR